MVEAKSRKATDLELVAAIKKAEGRESQRACNALVKKYKKPLLYHFRGIVNSEEDAEELTQIAFMKMIESLDKFNGDMGAFSTWFFKLTKNVFIDFMRKKKLESISISNVRTSLEDEDQGKAEFDIPDSSSIPEDILLRKEKNMAMAKIINAMSNSDLSEVIKMKYFKGLSYEEISTETGKPLGTIKVNIMRAKEILKAEFIKAGITL